MSPFTHSQSYSCSSCDWDVLCGCYVIHYTHAWPVKGKPHSSVSMFSLQACKPGVTLNYLHSAAVEMLASELKGELCPSTNM